jgi:2-polyprenyl-6-methoxyphenol hydroxylase-like FAD-dependent oxidoreductase
MPGHEAREEIMDNADIRQVAVIGAGTIGASWAAFFLSRGLSVAASDPAPQAEATLPLRRRFMAGTRPARRFAAAPRQGARGPAVISLPNPRQRWSVPISSRRTLPSARR